MPTTPRHTTSSATTAQARHDLARLRKLGLTKARIGRGKRAGGSARSVLKKFSAVLQGKASVISAPPKAVRSYKGRYATARGKIVVPKEVDQTIRYSKKTGTLRRTSKRGDYKMTETILSSDNSNFGAIPRGKNLTYAVKLANNTVQRFAGANAAAYASLINYLEQYDRREFIREIRVIKFADKDPFEEDEE